MGGLGIRGAWAQRGAALRGGGAFGDGRGGIACAVPCDKRGGNGLTDGCGCAEAVVLAFEKICSEKIKKSRHGACSFLTFIRFLAVSYPKSYPYSRSVHRICR